MSSQAYQDGKFLLTWSLASLLTFGVPMIIFGGARLATRKGEGQDDDEEQYNKYNAVQGQAAYNNQINYKNDCYWWQWGCDDEYQPQNKQEEENHAPWWWMWSEDERRQEGEVSPTIIIIYVWHVVLLLGLTIYGRRAVVGGGSLYGVSATCLMFANYSFISMLFLGGLQGAILDDASILDENGWYGQLGVLLYMTEFTSLFFGLCYFFAFRRLAAEKEITRLEVAPSDYMPYEESKKPEDGTDDSV